MVEEDQNKSLKRIRFEEEDEDGVSKLPDCLLAEILSRLPTTRHTIRTCTLSKRWKHIWTAVSNLIFLHPYKRHNHANITDFFSYVDKTLTQCRQWNLKKFTLACRYNQQFVSHIHCWIRYAVKCNVEELRLRLSYLGHRKEFPLDQFVFINSCFTHLTLTACAFNLTGAIRWENLRKLCIHYGNLHEDLIENILSGSPVLETLVLNHCYGYRCLNITSASVKNLVFAGYRDFPDFVNSRLHIIEINAPNILTLKVQDGLVLKKLLLLNVSSLVEAHLDYTRFLGPSGTTREEDQEETLDEFILNLRHVKHLKIGSSCSKALARLKAKGFISPTNLKVLDDTSSSLYYDNGPAVIMISQILNNARLNHKKLVVDKLYKKRSFLDHLMHKGKLMLLPTSGGVGEGGESNA